MASSSSDRPLSEKAQRLAKEWAQNPQSKIFVPLAEEYAKAGMLQRAALVLEEGIGHYPGYVIAMVALGAVYYEMKEVASAKDVLEAAIESSPENMKAHRLLAQIYAAAGQVEAARRSCTVVLMTNPLDEDIKSLDQRLSPPKTAPAPRKPLESKKVAAPSPSISTDETPASPLIDEQATAQQPASDPISEPMLMAPQMATLSDSSSLVSDVVPEIVSTVVPDAESLTPIVASDDRLPAAEPPHRKQILRLQRWLTQIQAAR